MTIKLTVHLSTRAPYPRSFRILPAFIISGKHITNIADALRPSYDTYNCTCFSLYCFLLRLQLSFCFFPFQHSQETCSYVYVHIPTLPSSLTFHYSYLHYIATTHATQSFSPTHAYTQPLRKTSFRSTPSSFQMVLLLTNAGCRSVPSIHSLFSTLRIRRGPSPLRTTVNVILNHGATRSLFDFSGNIHVCFVARVIIDARSVSSFGEKGIDLSQVDIETKTAKFKARI